MFLVYKWPRVKYQLCILIRENAAFLDLVIYFVINIFGKISIAFFPVLQSLTERTMGNVVLGLISIVINTTVLCNNHALERCSDNVSGSAEVKNALLRGSKFEYIEEDSSESDI